MADWVAMARSGRGGQHEGEIIAQGCDHFQGHVAGRCADHPWFCSVRMAPTRRVVAASFGKMPDHSVRRLTSRLNAYST